MAYETIEIDQARALIADGNATVIDIRDEASFASGHIEEAQHVNNDNLEQFVSEADQDIPLIVCCYHGNMSKGAADYFNSRGFAQTYSLNGGYTQWAASENP